MTNEEKALEIVDGWYADDSYRDGLISLIAAALTEAQRERDRLWCRALIETLPTTDSEKVLAWFNANRPDQDAAAIRALLPQQGGDRG